MDKEALVSFFAEAAASGWTLQSDIKLQEWLELFAERLKNKADFVTGRVHNLLEYTDTVEQELLNTFNCFRGLSSTQFVENRVYEEDETTSASEVVRLQDQGVPSQSYENDIVPRYREAVSSAWTLYEQHIRKPSKRSSIPGHYNSRVVTERWNKQLPHIIGTDEFMRDNTCGIVEERSSGMEFFTSDSETERDGANMAAEMAGTGFLPEGEWSESKSDVSDDQAGGFEPAVSAALDFKAMLEAALRSSYMPYNDGIISSANHPLEHLKESSISSMSAIVPNELLRNISEEEGDIDKGDSQPSPLNTGILVGEQVEGPGEFKSYSKAEAVLVSSDVKTDSVLNKSMIKKVATMSEDSRMIDSEIDIEKAMSERTIPAEKTFAETVQHRNFLNLFPSPIISGGLFDDDDGGGGGGELLSPGKVVAVIDSWSSPSIPDQFFKNLHMQGKDYAPNTKNNVIQSNATKPYYYNTSQQTDEGNDIVLDNTTKMKPFSIFPEGATSQDEGKVTDHIDLFSSQRTTALPKDFSLFRKGLFDDDSDEDDDSDDLFGSTQTSQQLQGSGTEEEIRLFDAIRDVKSVSLQTESSTQQLQQSDTLDEIRLFDSSKESKKVLESNQKSSENTNYSSFTLNESAAKLISNLHSPSLGKGSVHVRPADDDERTGGLSHNNIEERLQGDQDLRSPQVTHQLTATHPLATNVVAEEHSKVGAEEESSSWSSSSSFDHSPLDDELTERAIFENESSAHQGDKTYNVDYGSSAARTDGKDEQGELVMPSGINYGKDAHRLLGHQNVLTSASILSNLNGSRFDRDSIHTTNISLDKGAEAEESSIKTNDIPSLPSRVSSQISVLQEQLNLTDSMFSVGVSSALKEDIRNLLSNPDVMPYKVSGLDVPKVDALKEIKDDTHLVHTVMSRPLGSSKRRAPTFVKRFSSAGIPALPPTYLKQDVNSKPKECESSSALGDVNSSSSFWKEDINLSERSGALICARVVVSDAGNLLTDKLEKDGQTVLTGVTTGLPFLKYPEAEQAAVQDQVIERLPLSRYPDIESKALPSLLFGDEDDDEVKLFGPLQGGVVRTAPFATAFTKQKKLLLLDSDDEDIDDAYSKMTMKRASGGATAYPGREMRLTENTQSSGSSKQSFHGSLFNVGGDDENDDDI